MIQNVGSQALDQLSTKIRPKKNYKTNRKDLDGGAIDIQNVLNQKWLPEFHMRTWKGKKYNYCGPNTRLEERLARGDEGINRLDQVCKQHDIDYSNALSLSDKHSADQKMIDAIEQFPNQSLTERAIKNTIKLKKKLEKPSGISWQQQLADELHKPIKRNFTRRRVITTGIDKIWKCNSSANGTRVIDIFSWS